MNKEKKLEKNGLFARKITHHHHLHQIATLNLVAFVKNFYSINIEDAKRITS